MSILPIAIIAGVTVQKTYPIQGYKTRQGHWGSSSPRRR